MSLALRTTEQPSPRPVVVAKVVNVETADIGIDLDVVRHIEFGEVLLQALALRREPLVERAEADDHGADVAQLVRAARSSP